MPNVASRATISADASLLIFWSIKPLLRGDHSLPLVSSGRINVSYQVKSCRMFRRGSP